LAGAAEASDIGFCGVRRAVVQIITACVTIVAPPKFRRQWRSKAIATTLTLKKWPQAGAVYILDSA